jgi:hypothetical protein
LCAGLRAGGLSNRECIGIGPSCGGVHEPLIGQRCGPSCDDRKCRWLTRGYRFTGRLLRDDRNALLGARWRAAGSASDRASAKARHQCDQQWASSVLQGEAPREQSSAPGNRYEYLIAQK